MPNATDMSPRYSAEELAYFRELIERKKAQTREDLERMRQTVLDDIELGEVDSAYSYHMADAGTDAMEREKIYLLIARAEKFLRYLDAALERIERGTYGICRECGRLIEKGRLEAVPHTQICIECKRRQQS
jgi:DnaK suppressor protein|nr:MAG: RNA polymerase-binding protein DksA [Bacteroidota bacterium]